MLIRATIWLAAIGTILSAYFILAANSFMQNPVGYTINEARGRAELTDFAAMVGTELVVIGADTTHRAFRNELRWNAAAYKLGL